MKLCCILRRRTPTARHPGFGFPLSYRSDYSLRQDQHSQAKADRFESNLGIELQCTVPEVVVVVRLGLPAPARFVRAPHAVGSHRAG